MLKVRCSSASKAAADLQQLAALGMPVTLDMQSPACQRQSAQAWSLLAGMLEENMTVSRLPSRRPVLNQLPCSQSIWQDLSLSHDDKGSAVCLADSACGIDVQSRHVWKQASAKRMCTDIEWKKAEQAEDCDLWLTLLFSCKETWAKMRRIPLAFTFELDLSGLAQEIWKQAAVSGFKSRKICYGIWPHSPGLTQTDVQLPLFSPESMQLSILPDQDGSDLLVLDTGCTKETAGQTAVAWMAVICPDGCMTALQEGVLHGRSE